MKTLYAASAAVIGVALATPSIVSAIDAPPTEVRGPARVIDGDTLNIGGQRIRLWGIDAPERDQQCTDKMGLTYPCGRQATMALEAILHNEEVRCRVRDVDRYKRLVATCEVDVEWDRSSMGIAARFITVDLGQSMVVYGWAVDYTHYSHGYYAAAQADAAEHKRGIHQGTFVSPADYRHLSTPRKKS